MIEALKEKRMMDLKKALGDIKKAKKKESKKHNDTIITGVVCLFILIGIIQIIYGLRAKRRMEAKYIFYTRNIKKQFANLVTNETQEIRAFCSEVVDYREEFAEKDAKAQIFLDYIENLQGNEYIHVPASRRRVIT